MKIVVAWLQYVYYNNASMNKQPRAILSFEAEADVARMIARARKEGIKLGFLCNAALRLHLKEKGFARKKDIAP